MKCLIEVIQFLMVYQDVCYYLNGMLFEMEGSELCIVVIDGYCLVVCLMLLEVFLFSYLVIVLCKGVIELMCMFDGGENLLCVQIGSNNICVYVGDFIFILKLVDGCFLDYCCVLLKNLDKYLEVGCDIFKQVFVCVVIFLNEKFCGVCLYVSENQFKIIVNNLEQEEVEEILDVSYGGMEMEIGFNVSYVLDVFNVLKCEIVCIMLMDFVFSVQIEDVVLQSVVYVVMLMRLQNLKRGWFICYFVFWQCFKCLCILCMFCFLCVGGR